MIYTVENVPIGTKAPAIMGGHWTKTHRGWKWCAGTTFPSHGRDWNGKFILPKKDNKRIEERGNG